MSRLYVYFFGFEKVTRTQSCCIPHLVPHGKYAKHHKHLTDHISSFRTVLNHICLREGSFPVSSVFEVWKYFVPYLSFITNSEKCF